MNQVTTCHHIGRFIGMMAFMIALFVNTVAPTALSKLGR